MPIVFNNLSMDSGFGDTMRERVDAGDTRTHGVTMPKLEDLIIDDEFQQLHRQLSDDERAGLEANIDDDGCFTDPILAWKGKKIVVDGHNRLSIWNDLPDDTHITPPTIRELTFADRAQATEWIILHQLGRRNLAGTELKLMLSRLHDIRKQDKGEAGRKAASETKSGENRRISPKSQNETLDTASQVAKEAGVSRATVTRSVAWAKAVEIIAAVNGKAGADLRSGVLTPPEKDVIAVAKLPEDIDIATALTNWRNGRKWNHGISISGGTGFDTQEIEAAGGNGKADAQKESPAKVKGFDDRGFNAPLGQLTRWVDGRMKAAGGAAHRDACKASLSAFLKAVKAWQKESSL